MARLAWHRPMAVAAGFLTLLGACPAFLVAQQKPETRPGEVDQLTAQVVAGLLERDHLSKPKIDDTISKKWFQNYFEELDPLKYYFLKADLDDFRAEEANLDDQVQKGDLDFAKKVFERFLVRADERLADALDILKTKPDFTIDETLTDDPKRIEWPADHTEARDRIRKLIKLELLQRKLDDEDLEKGMSQLITRYKDRNRTFKQFDTTDLLEVYLSAMTKAVDPHSSYMGPKTLEDMIEQGLHLSVEGIGASLSVEDGYPIVKEIVPGGAADKDGRLQLEDRIVGIEKEDGTREDFVEKKLNDVVRKIRGPKGSKVKLIVQPQGTKEQKTFELTRQKIELVADHGNSEVIEVKIPERDTPIKIGVVRVPAFYGDSGAIVRGDPNAVSITRDTRKFLEEFKKNGVEAVIMDLRGNGGGLLSEAITLSGLFIDKGPVVQVREARSRKHLDDDDQGTAWDGPLAVLIDRMSASASEIFAGVIKDYSRGLIIGDSSTYGKGTVQQILDLNEQISRGNRLPKLGALKLTVQQFYRPNGESTQILGVNPDIHIPSTRDHADFGEGTSDSALKFDKVAALAHDTYNRVPEPLLRELTDRSEARRKADPKFQEDTSFIERLVERKKRHQIALQEDKFRTESRKDDSDNEAVKAKNKKRGRHSLIEAWDEKDYYNQEVERIVAEYVVLGKQILVAAPTRATNPGEDIPPQIP